MFPSLAERFSVPVWHFAAYFSIGGAIYFSIGGLAGGAADRYGTPVVVAVPVRRAVGERSVFAHCCRALHRFRTAVIPNRAPAEARGYPTGPSCRSAVGALPTAYSQSRGK
jgi:hypothetical protein